MKKQRETVFEHIKKTDSEGGEYWTARDLAEVLEYSEYRYFLPVVEKAKKACQKSGQEADEHFEVISQIGGNGLKSKREVSNIKLSRYACYLIIQNADSNKEMVAKGQTYFAIQAHLAEIKQLEMYKKSLEGKNKRLILRRELAQHNMQLAGIARDAGVAEPTDYAIFQDHGYKGLYGGLGAKDIQIRKNLDKNQKILDHMGTTELAANLFRTTQTEDRLRREKIKEKGKANRIHYEVGKKVRKAMVELGGAKPENLPPVKGIKK